MRARVTTLKTPSHRVHTFKLVKAFIKGGSTGSADTAEDFLIGGGSAFRLEGSS